MRAPPRPREGTAMALRVCCHPNATHPLALLLGLRFVPLLHVARPEIYALLSANSSAGREPKGFRKLKHSPRVNKRQMASASLRAPAIMRERGERGIINVENSNGRCGRSWRVAPTPISPLLPPTSRLLVRGLLLCCFQEPKFKRNMGVTIHVRLHELDGRCAQLPIPITG